MRQKIIALLLLGLSVFLLAVAIVIALWRFGGDKPAEQSAGSAAPRTVQVQEPEYTTEPEDDGELTPAEQALATRLAPTVEEQPRPADAAYFDNAAFLINSVSQGLDLYDYDGLLAQADFYGKADLSALGAMEYIRQMEGQDYGKIYISLGVNELASEIETIQACYENMLAQLRTYYPEGIIVLISVPPVSEYKSSVDRNCTRELVMEYNEMLLQLAEAWDVWYLDVFTVLANEDGYLPGDVNEDGIHFTPAYYSAWFERLSTHYVNDGTISTQPLETEQSGPVE